MKHQRPHVTPAQRGRARVTITSNVDSTRSARLIWDPFIVVLQRSRLVWSLSDATPKQSSGRASYRTYHSVVSRRRPWSRAMLPNPATPGTLTCGIMIRRDARVQREMGG